MTDCIAESSSINFISCSDEEMFLTVPALQPIKSATEFSLQNIDFDPFVDGEILLTAPATESQKEIWLGVQISTEANLACILSQTLRLKGRLNVEALRSALRHLVDRHESLRTTFSGDGMKILIAKKIEFDPPVIDLSQLTTLAADHEIEQHQHQAVNQVFDLQHGPLFRTKILKINDCEHLLIFTVHHAVCDGWSLGVLVSDLARIYNQLNQCGTLSLAQPEYFSEYAFLERGKIDSQEAIEHQDYWLKKFAVLPPVVDLPVDYSRPPLRTFNSACKDYLLAANLVRAIEQLGTSNSCSLMTTLLAAFEVFLTKITGQTELIVAIPTSGQVASGKYGLVGHCVNFLPLRTIVNLECGFSEYLRARNSSILDDYEHQDFTFGSLLKKLSVPRDASRVPLISAVFNIDLDAGSNQSLFDQLELEISPNRPSFATFEFFLNAISAGNGQIKLECQYNPNLYTAETIQRRLSEFEYLLTQLVETTNLPIGKLSLLNSVAKQQLLVDWNQTDTSYPRTQCIHQLFEEQVKNHGSAIALVFEQQEITYKELNARANQLANYLATFGIQPDQLVGVAISRSIDTIVSILAILKVGGAYLPLDLSYPAERLAFLLKNANVSILLTKTTEIDRLPDHSAKVICLDSDWAEIATSVSTNPVNLAKSQNLAYVMYTSGSTGQPKGVCVTHQGVVRLVKSTNYLDFSADQVFLQLAPIAFDASTLEIWGSLLNGAKLVLFPGDKPSLADLGQVIQQQQITTLWLTAGLFHLMVDERIEDLQPLRQLIAGGDVLSLPHVQKVVSTLTSCQLINGYGPTENTTFTCCYPIPKTSSFLTSIPIGRPISNTQVYILDHQLQPVPIGVAGELHIGGDGLARGYLDQPDLTAEKFIPNPFAGSVSLYKTGDLARYLPDGNIEFLGRIDNQVKIRGFRIELGEIEAAIAQHPDVREVRVIDREDRPGDKRLVAYIVNRQSQPTDLELRRFLQPKLPDYLIPSAFVVIDSLPLTPNGKVDRRALPLPEYNQSTAANISPRNDIELQLVKIWERLLGVKSIGIRANFFELGGHSLIAVRMFTEIERIWGQNLPLATLFQKQTIEELALILTQDEWTAPWSSLVLIQSGGSKPPLFCIHPIGGNILEYHALANYLDQEHPIYGLQSQGLDGKQPPFRRVEDMASHYIQEICTVQPHGPYFLIGYSFGGLVAFEMARQLEAMGGKIELLGLLDCSAPNLPNLRPSRIKSVGVHLCNLWKLNLKERSNYIMGRVNYRFSNDNERDFLTKSLYDPADLTPAILNVLDANLQAGDDYVAHKYSGKITLFRCQVQDLEYHLHAEFGWNEIVDGNLVVYPVPGPHFRMMKEPRVKGLAEKLKLCL
jgi:amino acid adenylation domain-containing protein